MARFAGKDSDAQSLDCTVGSLAESHEAARLKRAVARKRDSGSLEQDCWRIYRCPLCTGRVARRRALRARASAGIALRARTNLKDRHSAETEAAIRREDHS